MTSMTSQPTSADEPGLDASRHAKPVTKQPHESPKPFALGRKRPRPHDAPDSCALAHTVSSANQTDESTPPDDDDYDISNPTLPCREQLFRCTFKSALTDEYIYPPLKIRRWAQTQDILRLLYHTAYAQSHQACRIQLMIGNKVLENGLRRDEIPNKSHVVFQVINSPVLLTWEELCKQKQIPASEMQTLAETKAKELAKHCQETNRLEVNLADDEWDWRALLRNTDETYRQQVIGPGVVEFVFRLRFGPCWELTCANGDRWRLCFGRRSVCLDYIPFRINAINVAATWQRC